MTCKANNAVASNNQFVNAIKNSIKETGVFMNYKTTVWMDKSASGVVAVSFRVPTVQIEGSNLLAYVTLAFKGMVVEGFSFRELPGKKAGTTYVAVLPPSRKYTDKAGKVAYMPTVGFTQEMRNNITADVRDAWDVFVAVVPTV